MRESVKAATAALQRGDWAEAEALCIDVLRRNAGDPGALLVLGTIRAQSGNVADAERMFEEARKAAPRDVVVLNSLGGAYAANGRLREAEVVLRQALAIDPRFPWAHQNMAGLLMEVGDWDAARKSFESALRAKPDYADAMAGLADLAEKEHRLDDAAALARKALHLAPQLAMARLVLARLALRHREYQGVVDELEPVAGRGDWRNTHRAAAHSLLGQAYERLGAFDKSFAAFSKANEILRAIHAPRFANDAGVMSVGVIARLTAFTTAADAASWTPAPASERPDPVFFVGFPRSGTTLVEQVLASHHDVEAVEEQEGFAQAYEPLILADGALSRWPSLSSHEIAAYRAAYWRQTEATLGRPRTRRVVLDKLPLNTIMLPF